MRQPLGHGEEPQQKVESMSDEGLPNLAGLSIGRDPLLSSDLPASPASGLPLSTGFSPPTVAAPRPGGIILNITVQSPTAPVTINVTTTPGLANDASSHSPTITGSERVTRPMAVGNRPENEVPRSHGVTGSATRGRGVRYTLRGGGKARVDWVSDLEHIAPDDPAHTHKWYVVTAGLRVGIWRRWLDMEDYVDVKGSRHQSCDTREEAEECYFLAKQEGRVRQLIK